jgi:hypothetical protein
MKYFQLHDMFETVYLHGFVILQILKRKEVFLQYGCDPERIHHPAEGEDSAFGYCAVTSYHVQCNET